MSTLLALGLSTHLLAQITITNATFPMVGSTFQYGIDINPTVANLITPPGFNQFWNFSGLQTDQTTSTSYINPSGGAQTAGFPGADLLVLEAGKETYYNVTATAVELQGYYGIDPVNMGVLRLVHYNPPFKERQADLHMFDIYASSSGHLVGFSASLAPAAVRQALPAVTDSLRTRVAYNSLTAVDGYGTVAIPGGCFEVLREKRTTYTERRVDAKVPPLGWLDVTDVLINASITGLTLGVDTIVEYRFLSHIDKQEIAVLQLNKAQSAVVRAQFKSLGAGSQLAISNIATTPAGCPNANNGSITVTATSGPGTLTYAISGPVNQSNSTGVFVGLPPGAYSVSVTNSNSANCPATAMATVGGGTDALPPMITCMNTTVSLGALQSIPLNAADLASATDNCGVPGITLSPNTINASQAGQAVQVTATAMDGNGNNASCIATVTVSSLPAGWSQPADAIGCTNCDGEFSFNTGTGVWTGVSSGAYYSSPYVADAVAFASKTLCGNGSITAQVTNLEGNGWAGITLRENNAANARKVQLTTNLSSLSRREVRYTTGGQAFPQQFASQNKYWLRITRMGNQFIGYVSANSALWSQAFVVSVPGLPGCIQGGLVVTNGQSNSNATASFANVSVSSSMNMPAIENEDPAEEAIETVFSVFPNPTLGEVTVDFTLWQGKPAVLDVYDLQGRLHRRLELDEANGPLTVDLSHLPGGVYLFRVGKTSKKVVLK